MAGFLFKWEFSFSDGKKVIKKGDFIKSHEDMVDGAFAGVVGKHFIDALNAVVSKGNIAAVIDAVGEKEPKPFDTKIKVPVTPPKPAIKKGMTTTKGK